MKHFFYTLLFLFSMNSFAQNADYLEKVKTPESTLETLYAVISGEKGEARNWELFKYLFKEGAHLISTGKDQEGNLRLNFMSPQDYIERAGPYLVDNGFFEKGIHNEMDQFGSIMQVFSTYESYRSAKDEKPFARGINSIQLLYDEDRWWIINIYWTSETEENPIPKKYLPGK